MGELRGLYISDELHRKIKILAVQQDKKIKELVEEILKKELEKYEKNKCKSENYGKDDL